MPGTVAASAQPPPLHALYRANTIFCYVLNVTVKYFCINSVHFWFATKSLENSASKVRNMRLMAECINPVQFHWTRYCTPLGMSQVVSDANLPLLLCARGHGSDLCSVCCSGGLCRSMAAPR